MQQLGGWLPSRATASHTALMLVAQRPGTDGQLCVHVQQLCVHVWRRSGSVGGRGVASGCGPTPESLRPL